MKYTICNDAKSVSGASVFRVASPFPEFSLKPQNRIFHRDCPFSASGAHLLFFAVGCRNNYSSSSSETWWLLNISDFCNIVSSKCNLINSSKDNSSTLYGRVDFLSILRASNVQISRAKSWAKFRLKFPDLSHLSLSHLLLKSASSRRRGFAESAAKAARTIFSSGRSLTLSTMPS